MHIKRPARRRGAAPLRAGERTERGLQVIGWRKFNSCFTGFFSHCDFQSGRGGQIFKKHFPKIYDIGGVFCALKCDLASGGQNLARGILQLHDGRAPQAGREIDKGGAKGIGVDRNHRICDVIFKRNFFWRNAYFIGLTTPQARYDGIAILIGFSHFLTLQIDRDVGGLAGGHHCKLLSQFWCREKCAIRAAQHTATGIISRSGRGAVAESQFMIGDPAWFLEFGVKADRTCLIDAASVGLRKPRLVLAKLREVDI